MDIDMMPRDGERAGGEHLTEIACAFAKYICIRAPYVLIDPRNQDDMGSM
jgi:hypothetical protein